ncbi:MULTISPECIES: helix-turn-helix domain-containing protein [Brevibacillus]|jgi:hypothetical protein|uniref:Uncharacterized protein n=1 Tax=Brevibacillus parabrevis TaxID=54914 RepID=A0A4Y3PMJ7_BREPA|nr:MULTISPECIES: helix-turn-helix domain-containing protein [Brevibacillus]MBU8713909.1 helix-turn-helix domain-containing protein [Brevibacillus parabrevis]MDH6350632.1 transposase [Brevibacillus sp. 1238]MED2255468.1 helix-turn-helix domain-containing protein [Brevibacillus parabrevis]RNB94830.1 DNA-binding protein [Brevibacillus parabrevis]UED68298.1 helix-turn-helix domain-containing protein [Brevibacillus sp. HD3.3A]
MFVSLTMLDERRIETKLEELKSPDVNVSEWYKRSLVDDVEFRTLFIKMLIQLLPNTEEIRAKWDDFQFLSDNPAANEVLYSIYMKALRTARSNDAVLSISSRRSMTKEYSTGELATFFGVSQTTINKWIAAGHFNGILRAGENKHVKVPEDTWYHNPASGVRFQVKDAVESWKREQEEWDSREKVSESELYQRYVDHFEHKYGGKFADTLGKKEWNQLSDEEDTDKSMWAFFLERTRDVAGD